MRSVTDLVAHVIQTLFCGLQFCTDLEINYYYYNQVSAESPSNISPNPLEV